MNYLFSDGKKYCTGCWVEEKNPTHPELEKIKEDVSGAVSVWKCLKWYREDRKLPNGPYSYKKPYKNCLLYTSPSPRDLSTSRMPSAA